MAHQHDGGDDAPYIQQVDEFRHQKDRYFAASSQSPIPHEERHSGFKGLHYYPASLTYHVEAKVIPDEQPAAVDLATSTGDIRPQVRYATLAFTLNGQELQLAGFADPGDDEPDELFIPLRDKTSGKDTYGAGRYMEATVERGPDGATATLDFNLAYNPYCAYNEHYSCPLPPAENTLPVAIEAGERNYKDAH